MVKLITVSKLDIKLKLSSAQSCWWCSDILNFTSICANCGQIEKLLTTTNIKQLQNLNNTIFKVGRD